MLSFFSDLRLHVKVSLLGVASVLITAIALVVLAVWQSGQYHELAQREVDKLINADLDHITQGVYNLVRSEDDAPAGPLYHCSAPAKPATGPWWITRWRRSAAGCPTQA